MKRYLLCVLMLGQALVAVADEQDAASADAAYFDKTIAPLLASRCLECHSGAKPKGDLDLSHRDRALKGGENGVAIVASKPNESLLWERVNTNEMPPKHPLSGAEKGLLQKWLAGGAIWGTAAINRFRFTTDGRAGYDWWSLQPLAEPTPPKIAGDKWSRGGIDNFVLHKLQAMKLSPAPPASPRVIVRRLYFDLLGLPPTSKDIDKFAADPSDAAYRALVERLLESPHYGERWGRHWLDVARFGESDGFERNAPRKNLWPYRDWVIRALNDDMPYDQFVRMQLAGDILAGGRAGAAAVGFLVAGVHNTVVGGSERMKKLARQDELEEIVAAVGQSFLGLTINCARCHNHKFDPILTDEYYSMIAAIDGVTHGERDVAATDNTEQRTALDREIAELQQSLQKIDGMARKAILAARKKAGEKAPPTKRPQPYACWEFEGDLNDSVGKLHGKAVGGARIDNGALVVDGRAAFVQTAPLDRDLREKTLEAWVQLDGLDQRGGGVISLETADGGVFDAIVYGERDPHRWMAGSNGFQRTKSFQGPNEQQAMQNPIHVAIVYHGDGTIAGYRNGVPYGQPYKTASVPFKAGQAHVVFGMRHAPAGSTKMLSGRILRANLYDRALDQDAVAASAGVESNFVSNQEIIASLADEDRTRRSEQQKLLAAATTRRTALAAATAKSKVYTVRSRNPGPMRVHIRGSVTNFGDEVAPSGVAALAEVEADFGLANNAPDADRRRKLAEWVTNQKNPLFTRVMVNRVWHYHFGTGIVDTPNDLGFNGGRPSHPELLDWLAVKFITSGYRLKSLHRLIVTSAAYRQASSFNKTAYAKDAGNRLLWRYPPRRVEAEVLRDTILQTSGALNRAGGGPGFEDVTITSNNGTTYYAPVDRESDAHHRRTVYRFSPRGGRSSVLDTFDCPDPSTAAPRRSVTTTPLQALSLLNNAFVLRMAELFAKRVQDTSGEEVRAQISTAWQLALGRTPDKTEYRSAAKLVADHGLATLCRALFNSNEFVVIE